MLVDAGRRCCGLAAGLENPDERPPPRLERYSVTNNEVIAVSGS